uniref:Uncharacterized protein n=1 Tax=Lepeophtheirus salmonis TaxID=72036 RepID=A0A0K2TA05_LEPSM
MQGTQLCTFGWCLICLFQICFSWNDSQPGSIKSGVSLFVWPQMDRNTRLS